MHTSNARGTPISYIKNDSSMSFSLTKRGEESQQRRRPPPVPPLGHTGASADEMLGNCAPHSEPPPPPPPPPPLPPADNADVLGTAGVVGAAHVGDVADAYANTDGQQADPSADSSAQHSKMSRLQSLRQLKRRHGERTVRRQQLAVQTKASAAAPRVDDDEPATPTPVHRF